MNKLIFFIAITFLAFGCNAQAGNNSNESSTNGKLNQPPGKDQPHISWKVNKQYDENGNLIGYDSTYTYQYTNVEGDSVSLDADSVMNSFHSYFDQNFPDLWQGQFHNGFPNDSVFYRDFFNDDFFSQQWQQGFFNMDDLFKGMDSLRMNFFRKQYPGMIAPQPNNDQSKKK